MKGPLNGRWCQHLARSTVEWSRWRRAFPCTASFLTNGQPICTAKVGRPLWGSLISTEGQCNSLEAVKLCWNLISMAWVDVNDRLLVPIYITKVASSLWFIDINGGVSVTKKKKKHISWFMFVEIIFFSHQSHFMWKRGKYFEFGLQEWWGLTHFDMTNIFFFFLQEDILVLLGFLSVLYFTFSRRSVSLVDKAAGCCVHWSNILNIVEICHLCKQIIVALFWANLCSKEIIVRFFNKST